MKLNDVLYEIRNSDGKPFALMSVRSTGKMQGSIKVAKYIFADFIDTNLDLIKLRQVDPADDNIKTLKISHLVSFNSTLIKH